jgi:hypothetical protein
MKKFVLVLAAAAFMVSLPACKKCSTCKYTWTSGGTTQSYAYPEACGKRKAINDYEDACATAATLVGATCTCDKS